jgi:hypothetical protein
MTKQVKGTHKKLTLNKKTILKIPESAMNDIVGGAGANNGLTQQQSTSPPCVPPGGKIPKSSTDACNRDIIDPM